MSASFVKHVLRDMSLAHWRSCCHTKMLSPRSGKIWCCTSTATRFLMLWPVVTIQDQDETQYEAGFAHVCQPWVLLRLVTMPANICHLKGFWQRRCINKRRPSKTVKAGNISSGRRPGEPSTLRSEKPRLQGLGCCLLPPWGRRAP